MFFIKHMYVWLKGSIVGGQIAACVWAHGAADLELQGKA